MKTTALWLLVALLLVACWQDERLVGHAVQVSAYSGAGSASKDDGGTSGGTGAEGGDETTGSGGSRDGGEGGDAGTAGGSDESGLKPPRFGTATLIAELSAPVGADQDPALTADGLEIVFASQRSGNLDLWHSVRRDASQRWEPPVRVEELSSEYADASPCLAADGLSVWFSSDRPGGTGKHDIWMATRESRAASWSVPEPVAEVNSPDTDLAPSVAGNTLVLSSVAANGAFDLYLSWRADASSPWTARSPIDSVNSASSDWDPMLTDDELQLLFSSHRSASVDLFWSARSSRTGRFGPPEPLATLNTQSSDHDPWWSPSLGLIVFASDRSGKIALYEARALP